MRKKDFASLLRRGAAAIETPDDLTPEELKHVAIDLCAAADNVERQDEVPADVWSENPKYPRSDWKHEVAEDNTNLGYWEWVLHTEEADQPHGSRCVKCGRETTAGTTIGNLSIARDLGVDIGDFVCEDCDR
jgi:hypothetical protein